MRDIVRICVLAMANAFAQFIQECGKLEEDGKRLEKEASDANAAIAQLRENLEGLEAQRDDINHRLMQVRVEQEV